MAEDTKNMLSLKLDISTFDARQYDGVIASVKKQGYEFYSLKDLLSDVDFERKLFKLVREGVLNSPQSDGQFESYDDFCDKILQPYYVDVAEGFFIAKHNDLWVALTGIIVDKSSGLGTSGLTVVDQKHQCRGIAKVLKVLSLSQAKRIGATKVVTENHKHNGAMLAVNSFLGFVHD